MKYETLDVRVTREAEGRFEVHAEWAHGRGRDVVSPEADLLQDVESLARGDVTDREFLRDLGTRLFTCLFDSGDGRVCEQLNQCWGATKTEPGRGLRIRLRLEPPDMAALPWEFLFWPTENRFVATSIRTGLVRFLEVPDTFPDPEVHLPVRVLVVSPDAADLDTGTELKNLTSVLEGLDDVDYRVLDGTVTRTGIRDALREGPYHVLHFIGHGGVDDAGPYLILSGDPDHPGDAPDELDHRQFAGLLENHPSLELVTLNSCRGAVTGPDGPLVGMAQQLVAQGVPAVVAMQLPIYDKVALTFSREFYRSLFTGSSRGDVEVAVAEARNALETDFPDTAALGTPVLFLNRESGVLFDLVTGRFWRDVPRKPDQAHVTREVEKAHRRRLTHLETLGEEAEEEDVGDAREALQRTRRRLRTGKALALLPLAVAVLVFLGSWVYVLQRFSRWANLETLTVRLAELGGPEGVHPDLALVTVDSADLAGEPWGPEWRPRMATLIDRLAEAGARVAALDITFDTTTEHDEALGAAMARARERGTEVVVGVRALDQGRPDVPEPLRAASWGAVCAATGARVTLDLLVQKNEEGGEPRDIPSLPLRAVAAHRGARIARLDPGAREVLLVGPGDEVDRIRFASLDAIRTDAAGCPLLSEGDTVAKLVLDYSRPGALRDARRHFSFREVVHSPDPPVELRDKLVLVGVPPGDLRLALYPGLGGERRYGYEIMADGVSTLLGGVAIRPLPGWGSFLVILASAFLGAALAIYPRGVSGAVRGGLLAGSLVALLLVAVWVYRAARLMMLFAYPAAALLLAFWGMHTFRRWRIV